MGYRVSVSPEDRGVGGGDVDTAVYLMLINLYEAIEDERAEVCFVFHNKRIVCYIFHWKI